MKEAPEIKEQLDPNKMLPELNEGGREFLKMSLNFMFLLNGGVATTLIALDFEKYTIPILIFGIGILSSILITIITHFIINSKNKYIPKGNNVIEKLYYYIINTVMWLRFILIFLPLICSYIGMKCVINIF